MNCNICGLSKTNLIKTWDKKYSIEKNGELKVCADCFNLLLWEKPEQILERIKNKLNGMTNNYEE